MPLPPIFSLALLDEICPGLKAVTKISKMQNVASRSTKIDEEMQIRFKEGLSETAKITKTTKIAKTTKTTKFARPSPKNDEEIQLRLEEGSQRNYENRKLPKLRNYKNCNISKGCV